MGRWDAETGKDLVLPLTRWDAGGTEHGCGRTALSARGALSHSNCPTPWARSHRRPAIDDHLADLGGGDLGDIVGPAETDGVRELGTNSSTWHGQYGPADPPAGAVSLCRKERPRACI